MPPLTSEFRTTLRKQEAMQARVARDGYGRNSRSTEDTLTARYARLAELIMTSDDVCDDLDNDPKLAARWSRCERAHYGLPA